MMQPQITGLGLPPDCVKIWNCIYNYGPFYLITPENHERNMMHLEMLQRQNTGFKWMHLSGDACFSFLLTTTGIKHRKMGPHILKFSFEIANGESERGGRWEEKKRGGGRATGKENIGGGGTQCANVHPLGGTSPTWFGAPQSSSALSYD